MRIPQNQTFALLVYRLADHLIQLHHRAERAWFEPVDEFDGEAAIPRVDRCISAIRACIEELERESPPKKLAVPLAQLASAVEEAWRLYQQEWLGSRHQHDVASWQTPLRDAHDVKVSIVRESVLGQPAWAGIRTNTEKVVEVLPPVLQVCFHVAETLALEIYPTATYADRCGDPQTQYRARVVNINTQLVEWAPQLTNHYPVLRDLRFGINARSGTIVGTDVERLREELLGRLGQLPRHTTTEHVSPKEMARLLKNKSDVDPRGEYIGESLPILRVFEQISFLNQMPNKSVVILGPTGAGKSVLAELIHKHSKRPGKFVREQAADNLAHDPAIAKAHWAGIGTSPGIAGVDPRKGVKGVLEEAQEGTIFIDELADLRAEFQLLLFDVLDREAIPPAAGHKKAVIPDVRLIFATNKDIEREIENGRIKEDLWRRLKMRVIFIPPLAERLEDIFCFMEKKCTNRKPSLEFLLCLLRYSWPGNVGELTDLLELVCTKVKEGKKITLSALEALPNLDKGFIEIVKQVRSNSLKMVHYEVCQTLADWLASRGIRGGKGLQKKVGEFLGLRESTISHYLNPE